VPPDAWKQGARGAICSLAASGERFTSDDLLNLVGLPDPDHEPNARNNAVGSVFRWAAGEGLIETVGVTKSQLPTRKGGIVRVWQGRTEDTTPRLF
jgi:hypothetical protein